MTLTDMRCDRCGLALSGPAHPGTVDPAAGIRFSYHPGDPRMRDDSGVLCGGCWGDWAARLGEPRARECAWCGTPVTRRRSLHLRRADLPGNGWQLCASHTVDLLNQLRTVVDKLDVATFRFPLEEGSDDDADGGSDD
jgi:hypothetical protein